MPQYDMKNPHTLTSDSQHDKVGLGSEGYAFLCDVIGSRMIDFYCSQKQKY